MSFWTFLVNSTQLVPNGPQYMMHALLFFCLNSLLGFFFLLLFCCQFGGLPNVWVGALLIPGFFCSLLLLCVSVKIEGAPLVAAHLAWKRRYSLFYSGNTEWKLILFTDTPECNHDHLLVEIKDSQLHNEVIPCSIPLWYIFKIALAFLLWAMVENRVCYKSLCFSNWIHTLHSHIQAT